MSPLELRRTQPAARRRPLRHRRGHARRPLRGVPAGRRRRRRLRGRPARQGAVRAAQGDADAEPRAGRGRAHAGRLRRPLAPRCEMGQGVRALDPADGRASCSAASRARSRCPDPDTDTLAVRHAHDLEPLDAHDGPRAREAPSPTCAPTAASAASARSSNEGGLDPDTGQGIASTHWHQGAAGAHVSVDEETGRLTVEHLHGVAYAGRVVNRPGAELQNEGSMIMGLGTALFEAIDFGDGQVANANLSDYNVPAARRPARALHARDHRARRRRGARARARPSLPPVPGGDRQRARLARASTSASCPITRRARPRRGGRAMSVDRASSTAGATALDCAPTTMLLDALRDARACTSVRATCGIGVCGACTVLLDGEPVSGLPDAGRRRPRAARSRRVEGLGGTRPRAARVRRRARLPVRLVHAGLRAHGQAPAGGEPASPSDAEIAEALGGNLCRCGSLREDRRRRAAGREGAARVKLVTYDAGAGPRVGVLEATGVVDAGFDGDMVAFIEAGAPVSARRPRATARGCWRRCGRARCATSSPSRAT